MEVPGLFSQAGHFSSSLIFVQRDWPERNLLVLQLLVMSGPSRSVYVTASDKCPRKIHYCKVICQFPEVFFIYDNYNIILKYS